MSSDGQGNTIQFRVVTERSRCCGYGLCAALCPEVYKLDAEGLVYVESDIIPAAYENEAKEGAAACPAEAIMIEEVAA